MKAIVYSIKAEEKELLVKANGRQHELTLISNELSRQTIAFAWGKAVVLISANDVLDEVMLDELYLMGIFYVVIRSARTNNADLNYASSLGIKVANCPDEFCRPEKISQQSIHNLNLWEQGKCVGEEK